MADHRHDTGPTTAPWLPPDGEAALLRQGESTPEWKPWLALVATALRHAGHEAWHGVDLRFAAARPEAGPLLEGARVAVDHEAAARLLADLLQAAAPDGHGSPDIDADPLLVIEAGLRQDDASLDTNAAALAQPAEPAEPAATAVPAEPATPGRGGTVPSAIAHFAAVPLLLEAGRRAAPAVPPGWPAGYCPVCASWPTLVEMRGLERRRVLRCGRCATGWERDVLHCPYCGERDHRRQGALLPDQDTERVRVDVCHTCRGYVKSLTTLRPKPAWVIALDDLRTLPLDLSALERGYRRPQRPGWDLSLGLARRSDIAAGGAS